MANRKLIIGCAAIALGLAFLARPTTPPPAPGVIAATTHEAAPHATAPRADTIRYRVAYDAESSGFQHWNFVAVCVAILIVLFTLVSLSHRDGSRIARVRPFLYLGIFFFAVGALPASRSAYRDFTHLQKALRDGRYTVVEGRVSEFRPERSGSSTRLPETFKVRSDDHLYAYSYSSTDLKPGFNQTNRLAGPVRQMLRVRIADIDGRIARLEVAPEPGISLP
jgi:hypothetical protein